MYKMCTASTGVIWEKFCQTVTALTVHSWVYGLQDGLLRELGVDIGSPDETETVLAKVFAQYEADALKTTQAG